MSGEQKQRGRPRLSEEEKQRRAAEKAARPRKKPGPKKGSTRKAKPKAKQPKPAPAVIMANAEGAGDGPKVEGEASQEAQKRGAPTKFKPEFIEDARRMAEAGYTDIQMVEEFGIGRTTFYRWKKDFPDFRDAIRIAKEEPDNQMERSLYHSGNGFEYFEEVPIKVKDIEYDQGRKVKETERVEVVQVKRTVPPNSTAQIFWLKNRRPDLWRDKKEIDVNPHEDWIARLAALEGAE